MTARLPTVRCKRKRSADCGLLGGGSDARWSVAGILPMAVEGARSGVGVDFGAGRLVAPDLSLLGVCDFVLRAECLSNSQRHLLTGCNKYLSAMLDKSYFSIEL